MNDKSDAGIRDAIISQYTGTLEMMRQVIEKCPDEFWVSNAMRNQYWRVAYHALFFTHLYLQKSVKDFVAWPKHRAEVESDAAHERADAEPYSRQDILEYLDFCLKEVSIRTTEVDFQADSGFPWYPINKIEMQFVNIRHIQEHVGELAEQLSDKTGIEINWVGTGRRRSE